MSQATSYQGTVTESFSYRPSCTATLIGLAIMASSRRHWAAAHMRGIYIAAWPLQPLEVHTGTSLTLELSGGEAVRLERTVRPRSRTVLILVTLTR